MADSSRSDYKFIRLWSQLAPRISPPPKELRVWIWYRNNVLAHQELREKFLSKSPQGLIDWAKERKETWPCVMRKDGNRTSQGSFLGILKMLHYNHQRPALPFIIVSTDHGLGVKSRTKQFKRLASHLTGRARQIPISIMKTASDTAIRRALRDFVSVIEWSSSQLLVLWGPLALVNHDCSSKLQLTGALDGHQTCNSDNIYPWELECREGVRDSSRKLASSGEEVVILYRSCEGQGDFVCSSCKQRLSED